MRHRSFFRFSWAVNSMLAGILLVSCQSHQPESTITGIVRDEDGPVQGAVIRVQTRDVFAVTNAEGRFTLLDLTPGEPVSLSAWATGYYIAGGEEVTPGESVTLVLEAHPAEDHPDYPWLSAFASQGAEGNCQNCHAKTDDPNSALPFSQWKSDAHAHSAQNARFLSMYLGQNLVGNQSPPTRYGYSRDYGNFPLRPDPEKPYYGPGYKLDFPETAGNCAACHAPAAAVNAPYNTDPRDVSGVGAEGVACDFCHKIWDVKLSADDLPYPNMPGVLSLEFRRPSEGHQFFAGPYDDVAPGEDTFVPLYQQGQYCAACHFGQFWNVQIYNSFGEWMESPYSDPEQVKIAGLNSSKSCQDCHMPLGMNDHFVRFDKGGRLRDPNTIFSHNMTVDSDLLQHAVTLKAEMRQEEGKIVVSVTITNDQTGHHVPTDSPLRQLILLVQAAGPDGEALAQIDGPVIPEWGGVGDPKEGYYAGSPGTIYAKILQEMWTEVTPTGAYWNPTRVMSDNRIPALGSNKTIYTFAAPAGARNKVIVDVRLIYRRAFIELMDQKGWDVPDIVMEEEHLILP